MVYRNIFLRTLIEIACYSERIFQNSAPWEEAQEQRFSYRPLAIVRRIVRLLRKRQSYMSANLPLTRYLWHKRQQIRFFRLAADSSS